MQITIGEYATRLGCRAIVDACDGPLFSGVVITGGGFTQVRVWWDSTGAVKFPDGSWCNCNEGGVLFTYNKSLALLRYSDSTYAVLTSTPSPFDITEPKQMKEETKPVLVQKQRLIKLPDGSWVDPTTVAAITIIPPSVLDPESLRYWILSIRTSVTEIDIRCALPEEAQRLADDLAEKVNSIK